MLSMTGFLHGAPPAPAGTDAIPTANLAVGQPKGEGPEAPGDLGRLIGLWRSNERLLVRQRAARSQSAEARAYLARPDANRALGQARLDQLLARRSGLVALLRANRIEALSILDRHADAPRA